MRAYSGSDPDIQLQLLDSPNGSIETIDALQRGETDFGIAAADVSYLAFAGKLENRPGRVDQLRGIAVLDGAQNQPAGLGHEGQGQPLNLGSHSISGGHPMNVIFAAGR